MRWLKNTFDLQEKRINSGTLTLTSPEVKYVVDSELLSKLYKLNALVEEYMLLVPRFVVLIAIVVIIVIIFGIISRTIAIIIIIFCSSIITMLPVIVVLVAATGLYVVG